MVALFVVKYRQRVVSKIGCYSWKKGRLNMCEETYV